MQQPRAPEPINSDSLSPSSLACAALHRTEVGAEKPSPIIFEAAVQQLGVKASECVHVGDDRRNDVWGGRWVRSCPAA